MRELRDAIKIVLAYMQRSKASSHCELSEKEIWAFETLDRATAGKVPGDE